MVASEVGALRNARALVVRRGESVRVDELRSDDQKPDPKSESQGPLGYPAYGNCSKSNARESSENQVLKKGRVSPVKEAMGTATGER